MIKYLELPPKGLHTYIILPVRGGLRDALRALRYKVAEENSLVTLECFSLVRGLAPHHGGAAVVERSQVLL